MFQFKHLNLTSNFQYKDYADGKKTKSTNLDEKEFLRRFETHILPKRFVRIRHYGFLTNRGKTTRLNEIRKDMGLEAIKTPVEVPVALRLLEKFGKDIGQCNQCKTHSLRVLSQNR